ncbi:MAG: DUF992 domain-containing protein [Methylocella sp.]|nr:MAG: DUF992 domain-containing protein [Hyphomicrobiales bacterium]
MNCSFSPPVLAALLGAAFVGLTVTAASAAPVQSGVLECSVAAGAGLIIGSSKNLSCVFHPARGRPEYYAGTINRIGLDIGVTGPGQVAWDVITAGPPGRRYALTGDYAGPGVGFALGAGLSVNTLVGGNANSISLQPLSLGTSTGLNLSAGIGALTLQPVGAGPPGRRRHHG